MKEGREEKVREDVCEGIAGQSPESKNDNPEGEGLPFSQGKKELLTVVSAIVTAKLTGPLDLELLHQNLPGTEMSTAHWLKYRMPEDNRYAAFYKSGKFLLTGKGLLEKQDELCETILTRIKEAGFDLEIVEVTLNNIVCKAKTELTSSLESIYENLDSADVEYEPEQFPAMICKLYGVTFLLFSTGSMIITGAKTVKEAEEATEKFVARLSLM
jgi:transcription initiation factor TFIID TATA-box-binding protein